LTHDETAGGGVLASRAAFAETMGGVALCGSGSKAVKPELSASARHSEPGWWP